MIRRMIIAVTLLMVAAGAYGQVRTDAMAEYGIVPVSACKGGFRQVATAEIALSAKKGGLPHFVEYTMDLGLNFGAAPADFNGIPSQVKSDKAAEILLGARYMWTSRKVSLYSGAALGAEIRWQTSARGTLCSTSMAYHLTAIGARVEHKQLIFSGELGVGHLGLFRLGIGYEF